MNGDINHAMTDGIDRSVVVLIFVTRNYLNKVAANGPHGLSDNCLAEFNYALSRRGVARLIPVVLEPSCLQTATWQGPVGLRLCSQLYIDLSMDAHHPAFAAGARALVAEVQERGAQPSNRSTANVRMSEMT